MPLTSFLRASWAPAGAVSVSALRTIEKTAIRRYRMITSPNNYKLAIPVFRSRPHLRPEVQREFSLIFRLPAPESIHVRDIFLALLPPEPIHEAPRASRPRFAAAPTSPSAPRPA